MQVHKSSGRNESEVYATECGMIEGNVDLPHWAAVAVNDELLRSKDNADKLIVRHSASDSMLSRHPPGSPTEAVLPTSAISQSQLQSDSGHSNDETGETFPYSSRPSKRTGSRAVWGPVELPIIRSQPSSDVGSGTAVNVCADFVSVHSDSSESVAVVDQSDVPVFATGLAGSQSDTSISLSECIKKTTLLQDCDVNLADKPLSSEARMTDDLMDVVPEDELGGKMFEKVSPSNDNQRSAIYRPISQESAKKHIHPVTGQHVSTETVSADEKHSVKLVPDQSVSSETSQVDERIHLRMSSLASATAESWEKPECSSVKSVEGRHVSAETFDENTAKPCVRIHADRHASKETDSSLPVCRVSTLYTSANCILILYHRQFCHHHF